MKKYLLLLSLISLNSNAAYVFRGTDNLPSNINNNMNISTNNILGSYSLNNIPGVMSKLILKKDNTFSWYMNYNNINLQTKGEWKNINENIISLTTNPYPENIQFNYTGLSKENNPTLPKFIPEGTIQLNINDNGKGIPGLKITCKGSMKTIIAITDKNGWGVCYAAGLPLSYLEISSENLNLPNKTSFIRPNFHGNSWDFDFDYTDASTDYAFVEEKMKITPNFIEWNPISLKGNSLWQYTRENFNN